MRAIFVLALCLAAVVALPQRAEQRIIGGTEAAIEQYPTLAGLLFSWNSVTFWQQCGSIILSSRNLLTAAHCPAGFAVNRWRVRAGSSFANSGGTVLTLTAIVVHSSYNPRTYENDIAVLRSTVHLVIGAFIRPAAIAPPNYHLEDRALVWTAGWGFTHFEGSPSESLRHTSVWTVNQQVCKARYGTVGENVTSDMLCAGVIDVGGRDTCTGDNGGPFYHNGVVVGVISWGRGCGNPNFPRVSTRVSSFSDWIVRNMVF